MLMVLEITSASLKYKQEFLLEGSKILAVYYGGFASWLSAKEKIRLVIYENWVQVSEVTQVAGTR